MNSITRAASITLLGVGFLAGCGDDAPSADSGATTASSPAANAAPPSDNAVTRAAADFLDAVLKGDTQRASARLTPQAIERIIASGKQFAPPGLETATFKIGDVRMPSPSQALVQCVLTDVSADGQARNEELCCLMRLVENDWRVSGIAYGTGPDQPWTLSDFETGRTMPIARQASEQTPAGQQAADNPATRPSPPRTAQEPAAGAIR